MPTKPTILVTGSTGQLGRSLQAQVHKHPEFDFVFATRQQLNLAVSESIQRFFEQNACDVIVNCAAYTAVDQAETEKDLAEQINHHAVQQLATIARRKNIRLIHISTDYVFNGRQYRPYVETDAVEPQGVYGRTKLLGEQTIQTTLPNNALIIRTSWVYSEYGNNFVKTMLRLGAERDELGVIFDQVGTPTYAGDLANIIMAIVRSPQFNQDDFLTGIFHFSNEGVCSWYDFAKAIFAGCRVSCKVNPIETSDYPTPAKRPHYSVLNKTKIKQHFGVSIPWWRDSLTLYLSKLQERN